MGTLTLAAVGLTGSSLGAALGIPLLWPAAGQHHHRLMGGWLLAGAAITAIISARVLGLVPDAAAAEHTINLTGLVAYALLYTYLKRVTGRDAEGSRSMLPWLPAVVYMVIFASRAVAGDSTRVPFVWMLPTILSFNVACAMLVIRRTSPSTANALIPPSALVAGAIFLTGAQVVRLAFGHISYLRTIVPTVLTVEFVAVVALLAWRSRGMVSVVAAPALSGVPRYERSGLDDAGASALAARVDDILGRGRLFAETDLTLARLADACGATPHQVSESLNRIAGTTFHELVARHRVADVKRQLEEPVSDAYSIEGIGHAAGFGSRSALYAAFKKAEGLTPAEYRTRHRRRVNQPAG